MYTRKTEQRSQAGYYWERRVPKTRTTQLIGDYIQP